MPEIDPLLAESIPFQSPVLARSLVQLSTSFGGFFATCVVMYLCIAVSLWIALPLSAVAAGFLVRIFIIQHDCGHRSFFRSRRANDLIGMLCSLMTLTPYAFWRRQHARHHSSWNNLDRRAASGLDIYSSCMTVAEYRALGRWQRGLVRCTNHPLVVNLLLPPVVFIILYRTPFDAAKNWRRERHAVYLTNLALVAFFGGLGLALGYGRVVAVQLPVMVCASIVGVWIFSVQHRFEHALWTPEGSWHFGAASLRSTSYLRLPRILQWFTGNIGFHHVHHINPRIPNYRLEECHKSNVGLQAAPQLTLWTALRALRYTLWDGDLGHLVSYRSAAAPHRKFSKVRMMARRFTARRVEEFVFFDVLYEDGTQTSNRKVPGSELDDIDGDLLAKPYIEAQDRKIAEMSGRPRTAIKSVTRSRRR